jgi:hypothetical protein
VLHIGTVAHVYQITRVQLGLYLHATGFLQKKNMKPMALRAFCQLCESQFVIQLD